LIFKGLYQVFFTLYVHLVYFRKMKYFNFKYNFHVKSV
jgi:hypothetical protein